MSFSDNTALHDRVAQQQRIPKKDSMAHVTPRFFEETVKTNLIDDNGLPVFRSVEYVELLIAGGIDPPARPAHVHPQPQLRLELFTALG